MSYPDTLALKALRQGMTQRLADDGHLHDPAWYNAVAETPRHVFVPFFHRQVNGEWAVVTADDDGYFDAVYSDRALTTQVSENVATSSSSQPSLMLQMLEALGVEDGDMIGEVATGTGYNAALICHRSGDENLITVEVDAHLARLAKARLGEVGHHPTVRAADARAGFPADTPLDRLIITCGFDAFPYALARGVRPGGVIVCPLGWGNARITVGQDGTLLGRFLAGGSYFMKARDENSTGGVPYPGRSDNLTHRNAAFDPRDLGGEGFRFVHSLVVGEVGEAQEMSGGTITGYRMWTSDGSWAHVEDGTVHQSGPRKLWDTVERAYEWFESRGRPTRERFGVTITPDGQTYWLDEPGQKLPQEWLGHRP
ncbi:protein-L-isoaspartate(D-aspartate) O-methyltransferase [Streptomyces sp. NPDC018964]|uniref:protein-L-isoaspartate(D-aspartate) O-methyltransferase n=1 Tax=unclassified Streptomyces TaxID=2593676 RepID=UPI0037976606